MIIDIVAILSVSFSGVTSILHTIQQSKCTHIRAGCINCDRDLTENKSIKN